MPQDTALNTRYRGRFAPSPTGPLHLGSLYTALAGFLQARATGGQWLLRIDDVDPYRTTSGAADRIKFSLEALGLNWDGPVLWQSERTESYRQALDRLRFEGRTYPCDCSRKDLAMASAEGQATSVYPGFCRRREIRFLPGTHALRIVTEGALVTFRDRVQGDIAQNIETEVGDFILYRRDRVFAYHLATVLDDAEQGITEVLRGFDLLESTPRQIFLQRCLGLPEPAYAHVPILIDTGGQKLSKQTHAPEAETRRPGALLCYLLNLLNQNPPAELARAPAPEVLEWAIAHWDLSRLAGLERIAVAPMPFPT